MWADIGALPREVGELAVVTLDFATSKIARIPAELARATALRSITVSKPIASFKGLLPPGRWRKTEHADQIRYDRSDPSASPRARSAP